MTPAQTAQFNVMRAALRRIAFDYNTAQQILRGSERHHGVDAAEALEMAYENVQGLAKHAVRGVRAIPMQRVADNVEKAVS